MKRGIPSTLRVRQRAAKAWCEIAVTANLETSSKMRCVINVRPTIADSRQLVPPWRGGRLQRHRRVRHPHRDLIRKTEGALRMKLKSTRKDSEKTSHLLEVELRNPPGTSR